MNVFFGITTRRFHYDRTIARFEPAGGAGLTQPVDLALAADGRIFIVNRGREWRREGLRVTIMTLEEHYHNQFVSFGEGDGEAIWPSSIALDSNQNVYLADEWLNRVSIFDKDGMYLDKWGLAGTGDGEINRPACIRFDKEDNLYITDGYNNRLQVFTKDGKFLAKWGEPGNGEGQFNIPWGLCFDSRGDVYVADWRNTTGYKSSPRTANTWRNSALRVIDPGSSTVPVQWRLTSMGTSTSPTGGTTGSRCLPPTGGTLPPSPATPCSPSGGKRSWG